MATLKLVNSLMRGGHILKSISRGENKISKISESLNLSKGTTYRLLNTLRELGFVFQDPEAQAVVDVVEDELTFAMENQGLPRDTMR